MKNKSLPALNLLHVFEIVKEHIKDKELTFQIEVLPGVKDCHGPNIYILSEVPKIEQMNVLDKGNSVLSLAIKTYKENKKEYNLTTNRLNLETDSVMLLNFVLEEVLQNKLY